MGIENLDVKNYQEIVKNAAELTSGKLVQERQVQKARIKAILNGGSDGIKALLGNTMETSDADLLPAPNMLQSGIDRLAQKISGIPQVRVDVPNDNDSNRSKVRAEKLERIVTNLDDKQNLSLQLAQAARWLPGYGFCAFVITTKRDKNGYFYPSAELRDLMILSQVTLVLTNNQEKWLLLEEYLDINLHRYILSLQTKF